MGINRENYEAYFLDYAEGNLTAVETSMLHDFLAKNSDLKEELIEFENITIEEERVEIKALKDSLRREEETGLLEKEYLMIAQVENVISDQEKEKLSFLINEQAELMDELAIYQKTKLHSDAAIVFKDKAALLQKERRGLVWWHYSSIAAAIIAAVILFNWNTKSALYQPKGIAFNETKLFEENNIGSPFVNGEDISITEEKVNPKSSKKVIPLLAQEKPIAKKNKEVDKLVIPEIEIDGLANIIDTVVLHLDKKDNQMAQLDKPKQSEEKNLNSIEPVTPQKGNTIQKKEFIPIDEFAKNKIKKGILKGKTFSETVLDELADLSKDKISLSTQKSEEGETQKFALNIGKFSISRNR